MKLYWSPRSPFARKVMVCAHELGLDAQIEIERTLVAMHLSNATVMQANPLSKIPTLLRDDGPPLYDSLVICEYLNTLAQGTLFPPEGEAKWQALRWHALGNGWLDALILWRYERDERKPEEARPDLFLAYAFKTSATLAQLEIELAQMVATPLNIGHLTIGCALGYMDFRFAAFDWRKQAPNVARWFDTTVATRASFLQTVPAA